MDVPRPDDDALPPKKAMRSKQASKQENSCLLRRHHKGSLSVSVSASPRLTHLASAGRSQRPCQMSTRASGVRCVTSHGTCFASVSTRLTSPAPVVDDGGVDVRSVRRSSLSSSLWSLWMSPTADRSVGTVAARLAQHLASSRRKVQATHAGRDRHRPGERETSQPTKQPNNQTSRQMRSDPKQTAQT